MSILSCQTKQQGGLGLCMSDATTEPVIQLTACRCILVQERNSFTRRDAAKQSYQQRLALSQQRRPLQ